MHTLTIAGMVDPHVHLRGMEWSHKATFASETAAALAGGYWAVLDMPNTAPSTINQNALAKKLVEISAQAVCDWGVYFGASQHDNTAEYAGVENRVCGLKIYNNATTGDLLLDTQEKRAPHFRAWSNTKPIAVHAEGKTVFEILELVRRYRKPTHFCHISAAEEITYLRAAKEEGLPISIGVCPHHLYLTQNDITRLGAFALMKPELKTQRDQEALWQAVSDGIVDVIESDHAPHTITEKNSPTPPYGVPGLETTLPLMLLAAQEKRVSLERVVDMVSVNPRRIFGLDCPPETYTLVEIDHHFLIENQNLYTNVGWSPFAGMKVYGKVREVWRRGEKVFDGEKVLALPGSGVNLYA